MYQSPRLRPLAAALCAGIFLAAGSVAMAGDPVRVAGIVLDAATGNPLSDVVVRVSDRSGSNRHVLTDKHGRYAVIGLEAGRIGLVLERAGFAAETTTYAIPPGESASCDFRFYPAAKVITRAIVRTKAPECRIDPDTVDKTTIQ
jgi:hypothetical protein